MLLHLARVEEARQPSPPRHGGLQSTLVPQQLSDGERALARSETEGGPRGADGGVEVQEAALAELQNEHSEEWISRLEELEERV